VRLALVWLILLTACAALAPWLPLQDSEVMDAGARLAAPAWTQAPVLGTDPLGRDLLARVLAGARISLFVGLLGTAVALLVGVPYGALSGLLGGRADRVMMRAADALESVPMVVIMLFLLALLQEYRTELAAVGLGRLQLFLAAVGLLFWLPAARVARAETLRLRGQAFILAAEAGGARRAQVLRQHVLPNLAPSIGTLLMLTLPRVVLMEAFLSFLGLGVEPPAVSWGLLAADGMAALNPLVDCWWLIAVPSFFLVLTLWALDALARGMVAQAK
jgi:oligopeptide transport system permease protein